MLIYFNFKVNCFPTWVDGSNRSEFTNILKMVCHTYINLAQIHMWCNFGVVWPLYLKIISGIIQLLYTNRWTALFLLMGFIQNRNWAFCLILTNISKPIGAVFVKIKITFWIVHNLKIKNKFKILSHVYIYWPKIHTL